MLLAEEVEEEGLAGWCGWMGEREGAGPKDKEFFGGCSRLSEHLVVLGCVRRGLEVLPWV